MAKKRLNVSEVAEVLINEMDGFRQESELLRNAVESLKNTKVDISKDSLAEFSKIENDSISYHLKLNERIQKTIKEEKNFVPKWVYISLLVFFAAFVLAVVYGINKNNELEDQKETTVYWYDKAVELGYVHEEK